MNRTSVFMMMNGLVFVLTACVGGASDPVDPEPPYPFEGAYSSGDVQNTLGGVAIRSDGSDAGLEIVSMSGTADRSTRVTLVSDGTYDLLDQDGFDRAAKITDGASSIALRPTAANYTAVRGFNQTYQLADTTFDNFGVLGVITRPTDIPIEGQATYRGEAEVVIATSDARVSLQGQSMIVANFAEIDGVNVTMNSFFATDTLTGTTTATPVDTITVSNMILANNRFAGGTISTSRDGGVVVLTGANTTAFAEGAFFGFDPAISGPDEVGGMILVQGDDGILLGRFIAD